MRIWWTHTANIGTGQGPYSVSPLKPTDSLINVPTEGSWAQSEDSPKTSWELTSCLRYVTKSLWTPDLIAPVCGSSPKRCHTVGNTRLCIMFLYAVVLQFLCPGAKGLSPPHVAPLTAWPLLANALVAERARPQSYTPKSNRRHSLKSGGYYKGCH